MITREPVNFSGKSTNWIQLFLFKMFLFFPKTFCKYQLNRYSTWCAVEVKGQCHIRYPNAAELIRVLYCLTEAARKIVFKYILQHHPCLQKHSDHRMLHIKLSMLRHASSLMSELSILTTVNMMYIFSPFQNELVSSLQWSLSLMATLTLLKSQQTDPSNQLLS